MCVDNFLETGHAQHAGVGFLEIQNEHITTVFPERFNHRLAGEFTTLEVIGADVPGDFSAFCSALGIDGEHRDALGVGGLDGRPNREPVAWYKYDGGNTA